MLILVDYALHIAHIAVIGFNLFGWVHPATRRAHRWLVAFTAFCWLAIGPLIGAPGYCPLTDWHWRVKSALGEKFLPRSYIDYLLQMAGLHPSPLAVDIAVGVTFALVVITTLFLYWQPNFRNRLRGRKHP